MTRVGLVTIIDDKNYGNRLQNYAAQEVLRSLGCQVETLRNIPLKNVVGSSASSSDQPARRLALPRWNQLLRFSGKVIGRLNPVSQRNLTVHKKAALRLFSRDYIHESDEIIDPEKIPVDLASRYNAFVVGSDQVWNPLFRKGSTFDFLSFAESSKRIAYAPSFGISQIPDEYRQTYQHYLNGITHLSVREADGAAIIKDLTGHDVPVLLDPTLMLTADEWRNIAHPQVIKPRRPYVLTYFLGQNNSERSQIIRSIARKTNLEMVQLNSLNDKARYAADPGEMLDYISSCQMLLTDSFHGAVFALLFSKPFAVFDRLGSAPGMGSRLETLLGLFQMESRLWSHLADHPEEWLSIQTEHVPAILERERKKAFDFLRNALDGSDPVRKAPAQVQELFGTVIEPGYCIGCGNCAIADPDRLRMGWTADGRYTPCLQSASGRADIPEQDSDLLLSVCPFSSKAESEDNIGSRLYGSLSNIQQDKHTGYYLSCLAGHVTSDRYREGGSSGGMGTWLSQQLLADDMVDAIIHVRPDDRTKPGTSDRILFTYQVSESLEDLKKGAKSKYYPIELSEVLDHVHSNPGRYAITGVPCMIKAIRLLSSKDPIINERILYTIGLVCGHLKSDCFAKAMSWQMGIKPAELESIDFRVKMADSQQASRYGVEARRSPQAKSKESESESPQVRQAANRSLYVANWGHGLFKYPACDYCDDVLAETADISIGDAWLPEYDQDPLGTNIIVVRHPRLADLLDRHQNQLSLKKLPVDQIIESQAGGFRHRREGLAYRLWLKDQAGAVRPTKRVQASDQLPENRRHIYKVRMQLLQESHRAFQAALASDSFDTFTRWMDPCLAQLNRAAAAPLPVRVLRKIKRMLKERLMPSGRIADSSSKR